jgi:hypothetical protein
MERGGEDARKHAMAITYHFVDLEFFLTGAYCCDACYVLFESNEFVLFRCLC